MVKNKPRIYWRIMLFQIISIMSIMIIYGIISYALISAKEIAAMRSTTDRIGKRLAANLSFSVWNLDKKSADNLVMQEVRDPYLTAIIIFQDNMVWLGKIKDGPDKITAVDGANVASDFPDLVLKRPMEQILYTDRLGTVWEAGELALYITDEPVYAALASLMLQTVSQALVSIATLGVLTAVVLNVLLNRPLQQITATAQRIADGELGVQAEESTTWEITTLARAFNSMTDRLRGSLEELDRYFTTGLDLFSIADTDGFFRRLNKAWETTLGYSLAELTGRRFLDFVHPDDLPQTLEAVARLSGQETVLNFVNRYRCRDGAYRWIEWRSVPHGKFIYAAARDITKRKQDEDEIRRLNESLEGRVAERTARLEAMNRELETFAYSIAHDLRAPLRAINGYTSIIANDYGPGFDEKGRRLIGVVQNETNRMDQLIASLLTLSRIGRSSITPAPLDMAALARSAFEAAVGGRSMDDLTFSVAALPGASGDPALLRQVWTNLLSNAVKFTAKTTRAEIRVEGEVREGEAVYSVRDNGAGFDMRYLDKLFGVFQRLHPHDEFEGNGIGLALVNRIITMHGGRVWAESEVGKGAVFSFSLPAESPDKFAVINA